MRELLFRVINRPVWQFGMEVWDPDARELQSLESMAYQAELFLTMNRGRSLSSPMDSNIALMFEFILTFTRQLLVES